MPSNIPIELIIDVILFSIWSSPFSSSLSSFELERRANLCRYMLVHSSWACIARMELYKNIISIDSRINCEKLLRSIDSSDEVLEYVKRTRDIRIGIEVAVDDDGEGADSWDSEEDLIKLSRRLIGLVSIKLERVELDMKNLGPPLSSSSILHRLARFLASAKPILNKLRF